jgi:peptidoglycan hydrolase CwlO-like protein
MSTEEQDAILGRVTRESKECQREIAALDAKVELMRKQLSAAVEDMINFKLKPSGLRQRLEQSLICRSPKIWWTLSVS